jgi:hypothetical protein
MAIKRVILLIAVSWLALSQANATLTYDLRLAGGGKSMANITIGQVINLQLYAVVTGTPGNSAEEGFQYGYVTVLSETGGNIEGDLAAVLATSFASPGAQAGTSQDLDGDGDRDLGSLASSINSDFLIPEASSMRITSGAIIPNGREFKLADIYFQVTSIVNPADPMGLSISVWIPNFTTPSDAEAKWEEDGAVSSASGLTPGGTFPNSFPVAGAPVYLYAVPEPSPITFAATAGLGAAIFWRPKRNSVAQRTS